MLYILTLITIITKSQSMRAEQSLPYRTDKLQMSTVVFESMVNNLGPRIRHMNVELHFKTKAEMTAFISAKQRVDERADNDMDLPPSDEQKEEEEEGQEVEAPSVSKKLPDPGNDCIEIEQTFEKSILLREKFLARLKEIEERLMVKFMVVPKKVKISGSSRGRVDDAVQQYKELQQDICFEPLDRYGRQVFLSKHFRDRLKDGKVEVVEILKKYYFWFLKSETDPRELLQEVFQKTRHALYPLHRLRNSEKEALAAGRGALVLGDLEFSRVVQRTTDQLFVKVRAKAFQEGIAARLNQMEDRDERKIELSEDRKSLVMHMDADEQLQIQRQSISEELDRLSCLFLIFEADIDMEDVAAALLAISPASQPTFKKEKKSQNEQVLIWERQGNYVCVTFTSPLKQLPLQQKLSIHPLIRIIQALFNKNLLRFKLGVFDSFELPETEEDGWNCLSSAQRDHQERITLISPKNITKEKYLILARLYIEGKLSSDYLKSNTKAQKINSSVVQSDISIDMSRVNESTQFMLNDLSMQKEEPKQQEQNPKGQQLLSDELLDKVNFRFDGYSFFLAESEEENKKKYDDESVTKPQIKRPYTNQQYFNQLKEATTYKFKFFRIKLPPESRPQLQKEAERILGEKPQLAHLNRWVTVFSGGKECKEIEGLCEAGKRVKVIKLEKNHKMREGFLITTNSLFINTEENEQLPSHLYEPICFLKRLQ